MGDSQGLLRGWWRKPFICHEWFPSHPIYIPYSSHVMLLKQNKPSPKSPLFDRFRINHQTWLRLWHGFIHILVIWTILILTTLFTSRTAQGGGGSFKNRKPIGEVRGCESGMAERSHCWTDRRLISLSLFLWPSSYLPTYLPTDLPTHVPTYLSMELRIHPSIYSSIRLFIYPSVSVAIYLSTYPSMNLSIYPSIYLFIHLSVYHWVQLSIYLSIYPSVYPSVYLSTYLSVYLTIYLPIYLSI